MLPDQTGVDMPAPIDTGAEALGHEPAPGSDLTQLSNSELFDLEDRALAAAQRGREGAEEVWRESRAEQWRRAAIRPEPSA